MFSKSKINDPIETREVETPSAASRMAAAAQPSTQQGASQQAAGAQATPRPAPRQHGSSVISQDLTISGNLETTGDIQVEGTVEGDIHATSLTIGASATVRGEVVANTVVVNGRVIGRIRGEKVRLASSAQVEGDIVHRTIAMEEGADFQGSVKRAEDPLGTGGDAPRAITGPTPVDSTVNHGGGFSDNGDFGNTGGV